MRECWMRGYWDFRGASHYRLLRVPTLPHVLVGVAAWRAAGVLVFNLAGAWWRWLPGPLPTRGQKGRTYSANQGQHGERLSQERSATQQLTICNPPRPSYTLPHR